VMSTVETGEVLGKGTDSLEGYKLHDKVLGPGHLPSFDRGSSICHRQVGTVLIQFGTSDGSDWYESANKERDVGRFPRRSRPDISGTWLWIWGDDYLGLLARLTGVQSAALKRRAHLHAPYYYLPSSSGCCWTLLHARVGFPAHNVGYHIWTALGL
jgi:hypothetical protein